jgi:hypothetical protein
MHVLYRNVVLVPMYVTEPSRPCTDEAPVRPILKKIQKWRNFVEARFRTQDPPPKWNLNVRTDAWMKSFYLAKCKQCKMSRKWMSRMDRQVSVILGLVSVQSHTVVARPVRYGGPVLKKKLTDKHRQTHRSDRGNTYNGKEFADQMCYSTVFYFYGSADPYLNHVCWKSWSALFQTHLSPNYSSLQL